MGRHWEYGVKICGFVLAVFFVAATCPVPGFSSETDGALWKSVREGSSFVLLRHAIAPGTGDPDNFALGDCSTQRNLSAAGRKQALAIGDSLRASGIPGARVFSSQWCRCLETAELLKLGPVKELPQLNSFFQQYQRRDSQTQELRTWIGSQDIEVDRPLVLVTHQVNITALTGYYPASGELVIAQISADGKIVVSGSMKTD